MGDWQGGGKNCAGERKECEYSHYCAKVKACLVKCTELETF